MTYLEIDRGGLNIGVEHSLSFHYSLVLLPLFTKCIGKREREREERGRVEREREGGRVEREIVETE